MAGTALARAIVDQLVLKVCNRVAGGLLNTSCPPQDGCLQGLERFRNNPVLHNTLAHELQAGLC
jgi:hypothetical protein